MKTTFIFLFFFFACQAVFAQPAPGISVQGIARDAGKAALVDEEMTFTFDIQNSEGGTSYYKEDVDIRTDPYGVFSHIIGTGNKLAGSGNFNEVPFGQTHMKLVITVNYNGTDIVVSNSPFQYTPYAKSAENGVPTGTIVAFAGEEADIPVGWILCDGRSLTLVNGSLNLRNLIGENAPDLRGLFLRGTGTTENGQAGPALREVQQDTLESHSHPNNFSIPEGGSHTHTYRDRDMNETQSGGDYPIGDGVGARDILRTSTATGSEHSHDIAGGVLGFGDTETRPVNYGVNYIIKL